LERAEPDETVLARFREKMDDDFNTPEAMALMFELAREINRHKDSDPTRAAARAATLRAIGEVLGLAQQEPEAFLRGGSADDGLSEADIEDWIARRAQARAAKDWAESDRIRDFLREQGVEIEDTAGSTRWRRV